MTRRTQLLRLLATVACAAAATLGALAAPASATTQTAAASGTQSQNLTSGMTAARGGRTLVAPSGVGALKYQSVSPDFSSCPVSAYGYNGAAICGTYALDALTPNGYVEVFVIGTNWAIWHAWPGSNGWHSLGGQAFHETGNGVFEFSGNPLTIDTVGTDLNLWCNTWAWSGWHLC